MGPNSEAAPQKNEKDCEIRANKYARECHSKLISEDTEADAVYSQCTTSQPHCMPLLPYTLNSVLARSQPKSIKLKMRGLKLRSGDNWQWALKQKGIKQDLLVHPFCCINEVMGSAH